MATLEEGLFTFLTVDAAGVKALVIDRVFPLRAPDTTATFPYITYQRIGGDRDVTHDGNSGLSDSRMQLSCWSNEYLEAKTLALEVTKALNGKQGTLGGIARCASFVENELDLFDEESKLYSIIVDVKIWHSEDTL